VLIIFCFLTGGILFGVPGVILAVPVALTIKIVLATLYQEPVEAVDESQEGSA
jgi:predicted PurR-regulated permease PerM